MTMKIHADLPRRAAARLSHALAPLGAALITLVAACANAPPPASQSAGDPSNPAAEETPAPMAVVTSATVDAGATPVVYACPMHPEVTSTQPGQKCPKCGMALVPRRATP
jgi:hypothetical protein